MAESAVEFLIENIITLLGNEASLLGGLGQELEEIKNELESMRSFLKCADQITWRKNSSEQDRTWVKQVREAAYNVEDIIDNFMYHFGSQHSRSGFRGSFHKTVHLPKDLFMRHKIATNLQKIKTQVQAISERHQRYVTINAPINDGTSGLHSAIDSGQHKREASCFFEDDDIVGIDKDTKLLSGWLVQPECQRSVITVLGIGGSGKTTLVAKVYKNNDVKRYFDCYAWITVSQTYVIKELFRSLIKELFESNKKRVPDDLISTTSCKRLVETIINYLQKKRFLIVLDDMWKIDSWKEISVALTNGGTGSRVMVTTRKEDIANFSFGVRSYVHRLLPLQEKEAWNLFCRKAIPYDHRLPLELEEVAQLILKKCRGLPLAIVAMGGLMSSKRMTYLEWKDVYDCLNWELSNNLDLEVVKGILFLSYNDLPYYLKHCFRYCCLFPEDFLISRKRLIRLWVAEGFVQERRGMTIEKVADTYLMEIISRNMLQVVESNHFGMPKTCKMHDLMRELALSVSEEENFCTIYDESSSTSRISPRRLSIIHKGETDVSINKSFVNIVQLRSLLIFVGNSIGSSSLTSSVGSLLPSGFKLLRVLDMKGLPITSVPDELVKLFNLRYLNLKKTQVKELPNSIGQLINLQTLDIRHSQIKALPDGIIKCKNLRHVLMYSRINTIFYYNYLTGIQVPKDIWKLNKLQVLYPMEAKGNIIKQLESMTQLRKIGITNIKEADGIVLCNTIEKLKLLRHLFVMASDEEESLRMDALSSPPPFLQTLIMNGKLEKVPLWLGSLTNLAVLNFHWSRLRKDPFPHLHRLRGLTRLDLVKAYDGQHLCISNGWFLNLKELVLCNLSSLNEVIIENGASPNLEKLTLFSCKEMKMVPLGIEYLAKLQHLELIDMSDELVMRLRGENSIDRPRVQHIPQIKNYYNTDSGWEYESLSSSSTVNKSLRTNLRSGNTYRRFFRAKWTKRILHNR